MPVFGRPVTSPLSGEVARGEAGMACNEAERERSGRRCGDAKSSAETAAAVRRAVTARRRKSNRGLWGEKLNAPPLTGANKG